MKQYILVFVLALCFVSCSEKDNYDVQTDDKYAKNKESLEATEKKNPAGFLSIKGDEKKNIIGQTVVKGKIYSNAKVAIYKDVNIKLSFYSKTGSVLEEDLETIYETVNPGESKSFKSKYFTPRGTDSVGMKVIGAKYMSN